MYLLLAALGLYYLRYKFRDVYLKDLFYPLGSDYEVTSLDLYQDNAFFLPKGYRTGDLMAHAINDNNSLTRFSGWWGCHVSRWIRVYHSLGNLITMFFSISGGMTLVAALPLPFMAFLTNRLGRKTHKAFGES